MFTWICPQCGGEVLPSQDECPRCVKVAPPQPAAPQEDPMAAAPVYAPPPAPAPFPVSVPQAPAPFPASVPQAPAPFPASVPPARAPFPASLPQTPAPAAFATMEQQYHPPEARSTAMRDVLVTVGVAVLMLGGGYFLWMRSDGGEKKAAASKTALENAKGAKRAHPLQKQIEVGGLRLRIVKPGQAEVQMVVINHSVAEIANLSMEVVLSAKGTAKEVAVFPVKVKRLGPLSSAEVTAKAAAEVSALDMPDWQFLEAKFTILADEP